MPDCNVVDCSAIYLPIVLIVIGILMCRFAAKSQGWDRFGGGGRRKS